MNSCKNIAPRYDEKNATIAMTLSYKCNMRCSYCIQGLKKSEETVKEETLYGLLDGIIKKIKLGDFNKVIFDILGGEITEDIELYIKGIEYTINNLGDEYSYSMCIGSNGLDFKNLKRFLNFFNNDKVSGISVSISLDLDENAHNKHRKVYKKPDVDSYVIIKENIRKLMNIYGSNYKFDIKISSVCHCEDGLNRENILSLLELSNLNIRALIQNNYTDYDERVIKKLYEIISDIYVDILNEKINPNYMLSSNELGFVNMLKLPNGDINFCPQKSLFFINSDSNVYSCSTLTYDLDKRTKTLFKLDESMNSNYSTIMSTACLNTCSYCDLKVFCRKSCYYYNDHECIPWRKKQAECIRDVYRKILNCDENGEKLFKYYEKIFNNHWINNYEVLKREKENIIKTIKRLVR